IIPSENIKPKAGGSSVVRLSVCSLHCIDPLLLSAAGLGRRRTPELDGKQGLTEFDQMERERVHKCTGLTSSASQSGKSAHNDHFIPELRWSSTDGDVFNDCLTGRGRQRMGRGVGGLDVLDDDRMS
ncbi:hypothetical protein AALO_G00293690, partial [Alosa alosa]